MNLNHILQESQRRQSLPNLLEACFDKQIAFINDPAKRKALFVARRSGKTWTIAVNLIKECLSAPATKCLYYGLTAQVAWDVIYLHMIEVLCRKFKISIAVNLTQKTITFENRSFIKITGDDANDKQIDKALGGKYKVVVFDECQSITHDLESWIKNKLSPAMVDLEGTIILAGTPGNLMGERYWYRVTKTEGIREAGWNVHHWNCLDNPHMKPQILLHFKNMEALNAKYQEDPDFKQQWLCQWVIETSGRIYKYQSQKNEYNNQEIIASLLRGDKKWSYIFGMDYGFEDDTALVVGAFSRHDPCCYIVDSIKKPKMLTQDIAELILEWKSIYRPVYIVGDCQNKTLIETLRIQYRIPIAPAAKLGKEAHIAAMNSDFRKGFIQVVGSHNRALIKEWDELVWLEKQRLLGVYKENPTKDNHLADAALYLHHFSKHYRATPEQVPSSSSNPMRTNTEKMYSEAYKVSDNDPSQISIYDQMELENWAESYKRNINGSD